MGHQRPRCPRPHPGKPPRLPVRGGTVDSAAHRRCLTNRHHCYYDPCRCLHCRARSYKTLMYNIPPPPRQVPKRRRDTSSCVSCRRLWGVASAAPICLPCPVHVHLRPTQQPPLSWGVREGTSSLWRDSASRELSYSDSHSPHAVPLFGGMLILLMFHILNNKPQTLRILLRDVIITLSSYVKFQILYWSIVLG